MNALYRINFDAPTDKGGGAAIETPAAPKETNKKWFSPIDSQGNPLMDGREDGEPLSAPSGETPPPAQSANEGTEIRNRIKESAQAIEASTEKKDKTLPYFDETEETPEGEEPVKQKPETSASEETTAEQGSTEKYYDPQVHAKDKPVYPNSFNSRQDAEYAIAEKIRLFKEKGSELLGVGSEVGSTVPYDIQEKIEQYSDVTTLADASDDEIRGFIANIDMSLKGVDEKLTQSKQKYSQSKEIEQATNEYKQVEAQAVEAATALDLNAIVNKVGQNAGVDDVVAQIDVFIQDQLSPIQEKIKNHEADEEFAKTHGQAKFVETLRNMESELAQKKRDLTQHKQAIVDWNDKKVALENAQKKQQTEKPLTRVEKLQRFDNTYDKWKDDRKVGPFAVDIFTAPTAAAEAHFRSYAFATKNINDDLSSKSGWDKMYTKYKSEMKERFKDSQAGKVQTEADKRTSNATNPIKQPDAPGTSVPEGGTFNAMEDSRRRIKEHAKSLYK